MINIETLALDVVRKIANRAADRQSTDHEGATIYYEVMQHLTDCDSNGFSRMRRAVELVRNARVMPSPTHNGTFYVEETKRYKVKILNQNQNTSGTASCECADFRGNKKVCKHILAAEIFRQAGMSRADWVRTQEFSTLDQAFAFAEQVGECVSWYDSTLIISLLVHGLVSSAQEDAMKQIREKYPQQAPVIERLASDIRLWETDQ